MKSKLKEEAIQLRKDGLSYSEILRHVPVAKSTISLWLREVGLSKPQKQRLTKKKLEAAIRGGQKRKEQRLATIKKIHEDAIKDIKKISERELWLMGIMLYWAEGGKEKEYYPGSGVNFSNSDPHMARLFLKWLLDICKIEKERIHFSLYIHENSRERMDSVLAYWLKQTGLSKKHFRSVYFKKHTIKTKRRNIGESYFGNIRIGVQASSELNRKIVGWTKGIHAFYWETK